MTRDLSIIRLGEDRAEEAATLIGSAFQEDPLFVYGCPDPEERARYLPRMFMWSVWKALYYGELLGTEGELGGMAALLNPAGGNLTDEQLEQIGYNRNRDLVGAEIWDPTTERLNSVFDPIDAELHSVVPEPHWYLDAIGVDPARQGQGIGSRLIEAANARADADGLPIVLLTLQPRNVPLYERFGYQTVCGGTEPSSGLVWWGMKREADGG